MRKLLTLALALVIMALGLVTPPLRGTKVMAQPATQTIILNTGYDQWLQPTPALIAVGQKDNEWRVITDTVNGTPGPPIATGRPADVVLDTSWGVFQPSFLQSRWISVTADQGTPLTPPPNKFEYAFYFTLPVEASSPVLKIKLCADDRVRKVTLNNNVIPLSGLSGSFKLPPLVLSTSSGFTYGSAVNELIVNVEDTGGVKTGLIVEGDVTYQDCDRPAVRDLWGLEGITFWESTFEEPTSHPFSTLLGPDLITRRSGLLGPTNNDFDGVPGAEFYDVFYSDWDGTFNPSGQFVTIEAVWNGGAPSGGGLNISRVDLNFSNGGSKAANSVMSFVVLGDNALPKIVGNAVDIDPGVPITDTTMGNTIGQTQRLRLTVGFPCGCIPPPSGMVAWWPLDEQQGSTTVADIWNGRNGVPMPGGAVGPPGGPSSVLGEVGTALQANFFQGTGGYVEVAPATALDFGTTNFSIDAWVMFPSGSHAEPIVNKFDLFTNTGYSLFTTFASGPLTLGLRIGSVDYYGPQIPPSAAGTWIFVAATRSVVGNTTTVTLYVNDATPVTVVKPTTSASCAGTSLLIGEWPGHIPPLHVDIAIDELEIFNRALPFQPEIQNIFNARSAGKCHFVYFLQDDSNPSNVFLGNPDTGAYQFSCGGTTYTGVAQVTKRGNITTFQQNGPDRRMTATIDGGAFKGSATLQFPPGTTICTITDRDTRND